jgi:hypothetical protein
MTEQTFGGVYLGIVHDIKDPLNNGRVKLRVPQLFGSSPTEWANSIVQNSVEIELPKVNQPVWVMFQGAQPTFPVWIGMHTVNGEATSKVLVKTPTTAQLGEEYVVATTGRKQRLDLVATLVAMSQEIESLVTRVTSLESRMTAEENKPDLT